MIALICVACDRCRNGGKSLIKSCSNAVECVKFYRGPVECIDGRCCTGNDFDINYPDNPSIIDNNPYDPANPYVPRYVSPDPYPFNPYGYNYRFDSVYGILLLCINL